VTALQNDKKIGRSPTNGRFLLFLPLNYRIDENKDEGHLMDVVHGFTAAALGAN
jgi:hypothetical protein